MNSKSEKLVYGLRNIEAIFTSGENNPLRPKGASRKFIERVSSEKGIMA
ncbi:hypothetical protein [Bacteroides sp.]